LCVLSTVAVTVSTGAATESTVAGAAIVVSVTAGVDESVLVPHELNITAATIASAKTTFLIFPLFLIVNNK
jgi:hypothetical protein